MKLARRCDICGKGTGNGHLVAHCNIKTNRRWHPNLQEVRAMVDGRVRRGVEDATGIPVRKVRVTAYGAPKEA